MITTTDDEGNEALRGGMMKRQMQQQQGITTYFDVKSVQEYSAKVEQLGGKVIFPKRPVSGMGYFAMCADTENNAIAIWETDNTAK
jgi:predicted enzyme related to lactoylglutathione lyase